jgi:hypothetical protein
VAGITASPLTIGTVTNVEAVTPVGSKVKWAVASGPKGGGPALTPNPGTFSATVSARDAKGNVGAKTWSFSVSPN